MPGDVYRRSLAVVIGIDDYVQLPRLSGAVNDARHIASILAEQGFEVTLVLNGEATRRRLVEVLADRMPERIGPDDRVLVYFAGHGVTVGEGERPLGYLVPVDGDRSAPSATAISMAELQQWFGTVYAAKHVLFIADACYSGLALQTRAAGLMPGVAGYVRQVTRNPVRFSLVAGTSSQEANEWQGRGLFTYFVEQGIRGAADTNADGLVTSQELAAFVEPEVASFASQRLGREQLPQSARSGTGEFVFFVNGAASTSATDDTADNGAPPSLPLDDDPPDCTIPGLPEALARVASLEERSIVIPPRANESAQHARIMAQLEDFEHEAGAIEAMLTRTLGEPRCSTQVVEALDAMGRTAERLAMVLETLDWPMPSDVAPVYRSLPEDLRRDVISAWRARTAEHYEPFVASRRCDAVENYLRAARRARETMTASPAALHARWRLRAIGPSRISRCIEGSDDADLEPLREGELAGVVATTALDLDRPRVVVDDSELTALDPATLRSLRRATALETMGNPARARGMLETLAATAPTAAGTLAVAAALRERGLDPQAALQRATTQQDVYGDLLAALASEDPDRARELVRRSASGTAERMKGRANVALVRGYVEERAGRFADAVRWYEAAARHEVAPITVDACRRIARLAALLGLKERVRSETDKGLRLSPEDPWLHLFRALIDLEETPQGAIESARRAVPDETDDARLAFGRGLVFFGAELHATDAGARDDLAEPAVRAFARAWSLADEHSALRQDAADFAEDAALVAGGDSAAREAWRLTWPRRARAAHSARLFDQVRGMIDRRLPAINRCLDGTGGEPGPEVRGRLVVRFVVGVRGEVLFAERSSSTLDRPDVESCTLQEFRHVVLPRSVGIAFDVVYPLEYSDPDAGDEEARP